MTTAQLRKKIRETYPGVSVQIRTVHLEDLARGSAKFLKVVGTLDQAAHLLIEGWARSANVIYRTSAIA